MKSTNTQMRNWIRLSCLFALVAAVGQTGLSHSFGQGAGAIDSPTVTNSWSSFRNGGLSEVPTGLKLPKQWSSENGIGWTAELPGYGQSCPVTMGDSVIVTAVDGPQKEKNLVVCLSRQTGKTKWTVAEKSSLTGPSNYMFSRAAPTPIADLQHVFALFESGDLLAIELESGKLVWKRNLGDDVGPLKSRHGLGSSPAQSDKCLFVNLEHDGPSALFAIEKNSGKTAWKADRPSGSSWSSPIVCNAGGKEQVIVSSQGTATGLDADSGKQLWEIEGLDGNTVPSPSVDGNRIYLGARKSEFGSTEKAAKSNLCLDFSNGSTPEVVWRSERVVTHYASPVTCGKYLYLINQSGFLGCLDKQTGKELYRKRLGFECWATPVSDGTYVYVFGKNGTTAVLQAGESFNRVAENQLWNPSEPPKPVTYREYFPPRENSHSHGGGHPGGHGSGKGHGDKASGHPGGGQKPGAGMLAGLLKSDRDGDGFLSGDEIPKRLVSAMENIDKNKDGKLDKAELTKMAEMFAARRQGSRDNSRDPIVYGVAADSNGLLIRTGTRLYSISGGE